MIPPYTNEPDGHDCLTKIIFMTRIGAKAGVMIGIYDSVFHTKTINYTHSIIRFFRSSYPCALSGATFATVACATTSLRKKDDRLNYAIAGAVAGTVFGVSWYNRTLALLMAPFGAFMGFLMKDSQMDNWNWNLVYPKREFQYQDVFNNRLYTKYSNIPPPQKIEE